MHNWHQPAFLSYSFRVQGLILCTKRSSCLREVSPGFYGFLPPLKTCQKLSLVCEWACKSAWVCDALQWTDVPFSLVHLELVQIHYNCIQNHIAILTAGMPSLHGDAEHDLYVPSHH